MHDYPSFLTRSLDIHKERHGRVWDTKIYWLHKISSNSAVSSIKNYSGFQYKKLYGFQYKKLYAQIAVSFYPCRNIALKLKFINVRNINQCNWITEKISTWNPVFIVNWISFRYIQQIATLLEHIDLLRIVVVSEDNDYLSSIRLGIWNLLCLWNQNFNWMIFSSYLTFLFKNWSVNFFYLETRFGHQTSLKFGNDLFTILSLFIVLS
jgi:hypothetical protein